MRRPRRGQPAGHCEEEDAERSQPGPPGDCTGTEAGRARLRLHYISASLRTEAQGTRSSEAARGVFSRIMEKFFPSSF